METCLGSTTNTEADLIHKESMINWLQKQSQVMHEYVSVMGTSSLQAVVHLGLIQNYNSIVAQYFNMPNFINDAILNHCYGFHMYATLGDWFPKA